MPPLSAPLPAPSRPPPRPGPTLSSGLGPRADRGGSARNVPMSAPCGQAIRPPRRYRHHTADPQARKARRAADQPALPTELGNSAFGDGKHQPCITEHHQSVR